MARSVDAWKLPEVIDSLNDAEITDDLDDENEDKRCFICFELESTTRKKLFFVPCAHAACEPCVQTLRREAVCKAVKGVLCPYCRQSIENYSTTKPAKQLRRKKTEDLFPEHLKSTRFALKAERGCPRGRPKAPAPYGWQGVTSIGGLNDYAPPPNVTGAEGPGLKPNRSEENLLDNFQGLPLKPSDNLLAMAETISGSKQLHYNLKKLSGKKQKQLLKQLLEAIIPHARRLSTHHCGNYTLQRLLGFACQHRAEQVHGECAYTALVRSLCKDQAIPDISCHEKGTFVVQKMVDCLSGPAELKLVMDSIAGKIGQMANNSNACFSLERIVEICIVSISRPEGRQPYAPAQDAARHLCQIALELCATRDFSFRASQASNYATPSMLVECLRWSATQSQTRALLLSLANHADEFSSMGKWGRRFLQGLMSLDIPEVAEGVIDSFVGDSEKPRVGLIASLAIDGKDLFYSCAAAPSLSDWYREKIVRDFLLKAQADSQFLRNPHALQGLCFALSLLPSAVMTEHVEILKVLGSCSPSLLQTLKGMQAEYCLSVPANATMPTSALATASSLSTNGPSQPHLTSQEAVIATSENFPALQQAAQAQPHAGGAAAESKAAAASSESSKKSIKSSKKGKGGTKNPAGTAVGTESMAKASVRRKLKLEPSADCGDEIVVVEEKLSQHSSPETVSAAMSQASAVSHQEVSSSTQNLPSATQMDTAEQLSTISAVLLPNQPSAISLPPQSVPLPVTCAQCHMEPACVILLQCRHLTSCRRCAPGLKFCPLCSSLVIESFEVTAVSGTMSRNSQEKAENWSGCALVHEAPSFGQEPRGLFSQQPLHPKPHSMQTTAILTSDSQPLSLLSHNQHLDVGASAMDSFPGQGMPHAGAILGGHGVSSMFFSSALPNGHSHAPNTVASMSMGIPPNGSLGFQMLPHSNLLGGAGGGQQASGSAGFAGFTGDLPSMAPAQLGTSDQFPEVNLSFLSPQQGNHGTSGQHQQQTLMAPVDSGSLFQTRSFSPLPPQPRQAVRPAPYLPPGLF